MVRNRFLPLGGTNVGASCYLYELGKTRILIDCGVQPGLLAEKSLLIASLDGFTIQRSRPATLQPRRLG